MGQCLLPGSHLDKGASETNNGRKGEEDGMGHVGNAHEELREDRNGHDRGTDAERPMRSQEQKEHGDGAHGIAAERDVDAIGCRGRLDGHLVDRVGMDVTEKEERKDRLLPCRAARWCRAAC